MALTYAILAAKVRNRLNLPVSERLRIQAMIPEGLVRLSDQIALSRWNRHLLLSSPASTTATLTSGAVDLTTLVMNTPFINLERIRCGAIYITGSPYQLEWRDRQSGNLASDTDDVFVSCWLSGNVLNVTQADGTLSFSVPTIPTIGIVPDALVDELTEVMCELVTNGAVKADV